MDEHTVQSKQDPLPPSDPDILRVVPAALTEEAPQTVIQSHLLESEKTVIATQDQNAKTDFYLYLIGAFVLIFALAVLVLAIG